MFFHFTIFFYSLLYFFGLQMILSRDNLFFPISIALVIFSVFASKKLGKVWKASIVPVIFSLSTFSLLYLIDSALEKEIFIILVSFLFYLDLLAIWRLQDYKKDQTARGLLATSIMAAIFFFYASFYGIYLNFQISLWILMFLYFAVTVILSFRYFKFVSKDTRLVWSYSITLGMIIAEIAWVINFWPFGYLTTGVIVLMLYYVFWDLVQSYFLNLLSKKRVIANIIFFSLLVALVLFTSRWLPLV
jgi:hypothetical protein